MQVKWKKLLAKASVWLTAEILFNFLGLDNLADYSEFIFERDLTYRGQAKTMIRGLEVVTPIEKNSRSQKRSLNSKVVSFGRKKLLSQKHLVSSSLRDRFQRYTGEQIPWLQVIFRLAVTVVPGILPWVFLCGAYGFSLSLLNHFGLLPAVSEITALPQIVVGLNVVLSLLLALRTNAAHEGFWEGRKLWGAMVNKVQNLVRGISIFIEEREPRDRRSKERGMRLVSAFPVAMKLHLRREPMDSQLEPLMSSQQYQRLQQANHGPLEIAFWIGDYLQYQYERQHLNVFHLTNLQGLLDDMVDILGGCEGILKTPVPLVYTIALKVLMIAYFLIVPLGFVESLGWQTGPAIAFVSLIFLAINEVGSQMEEPFGHDLNDLPLDLISNTIVGNVEDLIEHAPSSRRVVDFPRKAA